MYIYTWTVYLLVNVKSLMGLKFWVNLGPTNKISKSPFSGDFQKIMPKVWNSYRGSYFWCTIFFQFSEIGIKWARNPTQVERAKQPKQTPSLVKFSLCEPSEHRRPQVNGRAKPKLSKPSNASKANTTNQYKVSKLSKANLPLIFMGGPGGAPHKNLGEVSLAKFSKLSRPS